MIVVFVEPKIHLPHQLETLAQLVSDHLHLLLTIVLILSSHHIYHIDVFQGLINAEVDLARWVSKVVNYLIHHQLRVVQILSELILLTTNVV